MFPLILFTELSTGKDDKSLIVAASRFQHLFKALQWLAFVLP